MNKRKHIPLVCSIAGKTPGPGLVTGASDDDPPALPRILRQELHTGFRPYGQLSLLSSYGLYPTDVCQDRISHLTGLYRHTQKTTPDLYCT